MIDPAGDAALPTLQHLSSIGSLQLGNDLLYPTHRVFGRGVHRPGGKNLGQCGVSPSPVLIGEGDEAHGRRMDLSRKRLVWIAFGSSFFSREKYFSTSS